MKIPSRYRHGFLIKVTNKNGDLLRYDFSFPLSRYFTYYQEPVDFQSQLDRLSYYQELDSGMSE